MIERIKGSVALLSHFDKVLALSKFALLKCENEVNPIAWIPWATSTVQTEIAQCWWPGESMLWGSLQFRTLKVQILKVLTLCECVKVKQRYHTYTNRSMFVPALNKCSLLLCRTSM